jgi:hypothetical protein
LENKIFHGHYIRSEDRQLVGGEDTLIWLLRGNLKVETGREIIAAQDQELQTKYNSTKILQSQTESECRM